MLGLVTVGERHIASVWWVRSRFVEVAPGIERLFASLWSEQQRGAAQQPGLRAMEPFIRILLGFWDGEPNFPRGSNS